MFNEAFLFAGSAVCLLCAATSDNLRAQATIPTPEFILQDVKHQEPTPPVRTKSDYAIQDGRVFVRALPAADTAVHIPSSQTIPRQIPATQTDLGPSVTAQSSPATLPNPPSAQTGASTSSPPSSDEQQTKRIMGALPNFRSVTAGEVLPPETMRQKLAMATLDNFDYTSLFFAGVIAADSFAAKATPEFHQGAAGYARYYWHTVADQAIENYFVELIVPAVTHEDSRYYAMGKKGGGLWKRAGYSLSRVVVTKKDSGESTFNISEIAGSAAAASISNFYYPSVERTVGNGLRNWGLDITYDAVTFTFHEFWPDISHALFRKKSTPPTSNP